MDFEEKGISEIFKKLSKTEDRFTAISDLQNNEEHACFQTRTRQLSQKVPENVDSPHVPKNGEYILCKLSEFQRNLNAHALKKFFAEKRPYLCPLKLEYLQGV